MKRPDFYRTALLFLILTLLCVGCGQGQFDLKTMCPMTPYLNIHGKWLYDPHSFGTACYDSLGVCTFTCTKCGWRINADSLKGQK